MDSEAALEEQEGQDSGKEEFGEEIAGNEIEDAKVLSYGTGQCQYGGPAPPTDGEGFSKVKPKGKFDDGAAVAEKDLSAIAIARIEKVSEIGAAYATHTVSAANAGTQIDTQYRRGGCVLVLPVGADSRPCRDGA